jgi:hypothetical protein
MDYTGDHLPIIFAGGPPILSSIWDTPGVKKVAVALVLGKASAYLLLVTTLTLAVYLRSVCPSLPNAQDAAPQNWRLQGSVRTPPRDFQPRTGPNFHRARGRLRPAGGGNRVLPALLPLADRLRTAQFPITPRSTQLTSGFLSAPDAATGRSCAPLPAGASCAP